ncbi:MAG: hypothetical protein AAGE76_14270, partial [Pseudomonadota bacterium]
MSLDGPARPLIEISPFDPLLLPYGAVGNLPGAADSGFWAPWMTGAYRMLPALFDTGAFRLILGTTADDTLRGGAGGDELRGRADDDTLYGRGAQDRLFGQAGDDTLFGGAGDDFLWGGAGSDRLFGDAGDDVLKDIAGEIYGGAGDDRVFLQTGHARGGSGADVFKTLKGGAQSDLTLYGGGGDDTAFVRSPAQVVAFGGGGADLIRFTGPEARPGAETTFAIHAAGAHDAATMPVRDDLAAAMQGFETVVFDLEAAVAAVVTASATTIRLEAGFDHSLDLSAAAHRNLVTFGAGHNTVRIAGAENSVQTGDGHDTSHLAETARATDLTTGAGADRVVLEAGATGQTGLDAVIDLGAGDDTLVTNSEGALHTDLTLFGGAGDDTLTLTNVERVTAFGGEGQDSVTV